jgi:hypothetical protein
MYIYYPAHNYIGDRMSTTKLAEIDTEELKTELKRRDLLALARKDPIGFSNDVQWTVLTHGLDKKDANEVSKLVRTGQPEKAIDKLFRSSFKPIKPSVT